MAPPKSERNSPDHYGDKPDWWQLAQSSRVSGHKGDGNLVFVDNPKKQGVDKRGEFAGHRIRNDKVTFDRNSQPDAPVQKDIVDTVNKMLDPKGGVKGLKSININSTTGGQHSKESRHYKGAAIDIDAINGQAVNADNPMVKKVQEWLESNGFADQENVGPTWRNRKVGGHNKHLHYGGNKERYRRYEPNKGRTR